MILELVAANFIVFLATIVQAATGVGFAMVAVPLLALINLAWVPAPMLICNIALSLTIMNRGRGDLVHTEAPPLVLGLTFGTFAGAGVLSLFTDRGLEAMIGGIIVTAVVASLIAPQFVINRGRLFLASFIGGATGAIAAMHGPPLIILYQREPPRKVRATMAGVFIFGSLLALASFWLAGLLGWNDLWRGLLLLPGVAMGYIVGRAVGGRMSPGVVRYAMLAIAGSAGLALLAKSL